MPGLNDIKNLLQHNRITDFVKFNKMSTRDIVDFSNKYSPEMVLRHTGKKEKKSRKLKLSAEITPVFTDYITTYKVEDILFPYSQRFTRYLLTGVAARAGVKKQVSAQILRDTCAVRQLRRGEAMAGLGSSLAGTGGCIDFIGKDLC